MAKPSAPLRNRSAGPFSRCCPGARWKALASHDCSLIIQFCSGAFQKVYWPGDLVESVYTLNTVQISNRSSKKPLNVIDFPAALPSDPPSNFCSTAPALKRCQADAGPSSRTD